MQPPQPQPMALPQAHPPPLGRGAYLVGRGMGFGASQPLLRLPSGQLVGLPSNDFLRQRGTPDLMACQELFQRQNEGPHKTFEPPPHWGPKVCNRVPQLTLSADAGAYPGGGGGAGRVNIGVNAQYTSVGAPPNSSQQIQQQTAQNQQLRSQAPPLPPAHNPHNTGGGPQSLSHQQQHHPHSQAALHHHQVLTSGGATSGLPNSVQQVSSGVGPPGSNPSQQGQQHDLSGQGILPQVSQHQLQQVQQGIVLPAGASHQIMYQQNNQNAQQQGQQQPNAQTHQQYYQQQNAAHLQSGQRQLLHQQPMHASNYQFMQTNMMPSIMQHPNPTHIYQQYQPISQGRPGATPQYQPMTIAAGQAPYPIQQYHQLQAPIYYPQQQVKAQSVLLPPPAAREKKIIPIIDPETQHNILDDLSTNISKSNHPDSPIQSRDSSASNTPAPRGTPPSKPVSNIPAQFALQVTQAATGIDKNKEIVNDSGISTINSEVASSNVDSIVNEVREKVSSISNNCVDNTSKDTDINKIARNVPDHNISKTIQTAASSYQPTQPQPPTVSTQPSQLPPPQPQRQVKQVRGGTSAATPMPNQSGIQSQPQQAKVSGNQQQVKQTAQPQQSKSPNQSQQKSNGSPVLSTAKGIPANSQHGSQQPKVNPTQSQGSQKSVHQQPIKHHLSKVATEQQPPKVVTVEQHQQKAAHVEHTQSKVAVESYQPKGPADQQLVSVDHQPKLSVEQPSKVSAEPQQQKTSIDNTHLKGELPSKTVNDHKHIPKVTDEQIPKGASQTGNFAQALLNQSPPARVQAATGPSSLHAINSQSNQTHVQDVASVPVNVPVLPVGKPTAPQQILVLSDQQVSKGGTSVSNVSSVIPPSRLYGDQPSQLAGAPIKPVEKRSITEEPTTQPNQMEQQKIPVNTKSSSPVSVGRNDNSGKRGKEKSVEENAVPLQNQDVKEENISSEVLSKAPSQLIVEAPKPKSTVENATELLKSLAIVEETGKQPTTSNTSHIPKSASDFFFFSSLDNVSKDNEVSQPLIAMLPQSIDRDSLMTKQRNQLFDNTKQTKRINHYEEGSSRKVNTWLMNSGFPNQTVKEMPIEETKETVEKPASPQLPDVPKPSVEKATELLQSLKFIPKPDSPSEKEKESQPAAKVNQIPKAMNDSAISVVDLFSPSFVNRMPVPVRNTEPLMNEHGSHPFQHTNNIANHEDGIFRKVNKFPKKISTTEQPNFAEPIQNDTTTAMAPPKTDSGKRQYDRDFLIGLQQNPLSLMRPDSLPNLEVVLDGPHPKSYEFKQPKMMQDFTPSFMQNANRNRGGQMPYNMQQKVIGRNSQQGRRGQKIIDIKLSSSSEVKLKTTENAWKPSNKEKVVKEDTVDGQNQKHEDLLKRVRGILNKLTPDNFEKLTGKVKSLPIETYFDLEGIIGLVFEKAVDEQAFSTTYAQLCQVLSTMAVKYDEGNQSSKDVGKDAKFRNLIINRCQKEFEKDNSKDIKFIEMTKKLESCTSVDEKLELKALIDYEETRLRKRSVGNIRFIGELYKLKMLTSPIMMRIIDGLLKKKDEESLECLCKLLTTIGKILETSAKSSTKAQEEFNSRFIDMRAIIDDKNAASSRVRFLLMDVIDLRKNFWVPRREETTNPKTKAEVHADIKKEEEQMIHQLHTMSNNSTPRRDERDNRDNKKRGGRENRNMDDGEWNTVGAVNSNNVRRIPMDGNRIKNTKFQNSDSTGMEFKAQFSSWAHGSSMGGSSIGQRGIKEAEVDECGASNNRYSVLDNTRSLDIRRNMGPSNSNNPRLAPSSGNHFVRPTNFGSRSMPPPNSDKDNAISAIKNFVHPADRSKSNSRSSSRDNSRDSRVKEVITPSVPEVTLSEENIEKYSKNLLEEYISVQDLKEAQLCVDEKFPPPYLEKLIKYMFDWVLDRKADKQILIGRLFHALLKSKKLTLDQFLAGTRDTIELLGDIQLDIPQILGNLGQVFALCLVDGVLSLQDLLRILNRTRTPEPSDLPSSKELGITVFAKTLSAATKLMGVSSVRSQWVKSGLKWEDYVTEMPVDDFLRQHGVNFTIEDEPEPELKPAPEIVKPVVKIVAGFDIVKVKKELLAMFKRNATQEEIFSWIDINVGSHANRTPAFVRALSQALIESKMITSSDGSSLAIADDFPERLKQQAKMITKYVDNNEELELAVILGIQQLSVENQHPPGFMEKSFNALYDMDVLSEESFYEWEKNDDPEAQLGKGVCVTSVRNFLSWLKTSDFDQLEQTKQIDQPK